MRGQRGKLRATCSAEGASQLGWCYGGCRGGPSGLRPDWWQTEACPTLRGVEIDAGLRVTLGGMNPAGLTERVRVLLGARGYLDEPRDLALYEYDAGVDKHAPDLVVFPRGTAEVAALVKLAQEFGVPFVGRGAGTGLSGGAIPREGGMMIAFILGLSQALLRGIDLRCGCFGGAELATWGTVARDALILAAIVPVIWLGSGGLISALKRK